MTSGTMMCYPSSGLLNRLLGSRAVDVVNGYAKSGQPFLLSLHFNAPHWPWRARATRRSRCACGNRVAEAS